MRLTVMYLGKHWETKRREPLRKGVRSESKRYGTQE